MTGTRNRRGPVRCVVGRPALPVLLALLGLLAVSIRAAPAGAHANLVRSTPTAGAVLPASPAQAQLWFSEQPDPHFSDIKVVDPNGKRYDAGDLHPAPGDPLSLIVGIKPLPDGLYTIAWKTVSAVDGHVVYGSIPFYVGQPPQGAALPAASQTGPASSGGLPGPGQVTVRWLGLLSGVALLGGFLFWPLVLLPGLVVAAAPRPGPGATAARTPRGVTAVAAPPRLERRALQVLAVAWVLLAASAIIALMQQAMASAGVDLPHVFGAPLRDQLLHTRYGHVWWLRAACTALAGAAVLLRARVNGGGRRTLVVGAFGALAVEGVFLSYSLNSHAAALTSMSGLATASDFVHLSATGLWIGGLLQFVLIVPVCLWALHGSGRLDFLATAVPRFSTLAFGCVAVLIATGTYQAVRQLPGWDAFLNTGYGRTLLVKLLLFLPLLALGAANLLVLKPALVRAAQGDDARPGVLRRVRFSADSLPRWPRRACWASPCSAWWGCW